MDEDKVIAFPGADATAAADEARISPAGTGQLGIPGLTADQEKAIQVVMSGMSFVLVGIRPTDSSADFFTALDGDSADLGQARPHLSGVIDRAFQRRGLA